MKLRESILNSKDRVGEILTHEDIPEWLEEGQTVKVQSISEATRRKLLKDCSDAEGNLDLEKFTPALLIETLVDPLNGQPVFSAADRDAVAAKSSIVVDRVGKVAMEVCGFADKAVMEKNSESREHERPSDSQSGSTKRSKKS